MIKRPLPRAIRKRLRKYHPFTPSPQLPSPTLGSLDPMTRRKTVLARLRMDVDLTDEDFDVLKDEKDARWLEWSAEPQLWSKFKRLADEMTAQVEKSAHEVQNEGSQGETGKDGEEVQKKERSNKLAHRLCYLHK